MKHLKLYEEINKPEIGDYVIITSSYYDPDDNDKMEKWFSNHIGKIVDYKITKDEFYYGHIENKYQIKFDDKFSKEILYSLDCDMTGLPNRYGDNLYEIDINGDKIQNDYTLTHKKYKDRIWLNDKWISDYSKDINDLEAKLASKKYNL